MKNFTVKAESLPERCEICHQADQFNRETGDCARCSPLATQAAAPPEWQPQPFTPAPPFTPQPPAVPHPFAPPQPFPYPPPVSPLAPTLPRVIHENPTLQVRYQPPPRLQYRYIGPTAVSEWVRVRDTALGGLVGALPIALIGMFFILNAEPMFYFALIGAIAAGGVAGFRVGNLLRSARQRTEAKTFRQRGTLSGMFVTFPMMASLFLYTLVSAIREIPGSVLSAIPLITFVILAYTSFFIGINGLCGYLAARTVELLERRHLVATTTTD